MILKKLEIVLLIQQTCIRCRSVHNTNLGPEGVGEEMQAVRKRKVQLEDKK